MVGRVPPPAPPCPRAEPPWSGSIKWIMLDSYNNVRRFQMRLLTVLVVSLGLVHSPLSAQILGLGKKKADDPKEQAKKSEQAARSYEKLKEFSTNLYTTDSDFREDVDKHFDQVQQQHTQEAFENN